MEQQSARICLIALIGLPASGKSTFSKWLVEQWKENDFSIQHVCYDDYLKIPATRNMNEFKFKKQRSEIFETLRLLINKRKKEIENCEKMVLICDDNHYYRSMRYELYQLCRKEHCAFAQIYFECQPIEAMRRNEAREEGKRVPREIIEKMAQCLEMPQEKWESLTLTLKSDFKDRYSEEEILQFLCGVFVNGLPPPQVEDIAKKQILQSDLHQLDVLLRKRVGELLKNVSVEEKSMKAAKLNARRKQILKNIKEGNFVEDWGTIELNRYVDLL